MVYDTRRRTKEQERDCSMTAKRRDALGIVTYRILQSRGIDTRTLDTIAAVFEKRGFSATICRQPNKSNLSHWFTGKHRPPARYGDWFLDAFGLNEQETYWLAWVLLTKDQLPPDFPHHAKESRADET